MSTDLLTQIHQRQQERLKIASGSAPLPAHEPEMLYIGCVDARLDPVKDIGIEQGRALIYRNIGALVPPQHAQHEGLPPESESVGAVLEFFLKIPAVKDESGNKKVKHIVVSGHTHCGGVHYACQHNLGGDAGDWFLPRYLSMLAGAVRKVFGMENPPDVNAALQMRKVEHESVRRSIDNLMKYDVVKKAVVAGEVEIHGWVLDTATKRIEEMEKNKNGEFTGVFKPMAGNQPGQTR